MDSIPEDVIAHPGSHEHGSGERQWQSSVVLSLRELLHHCDQKMNQLRRKAKSDPSQDPTIQLSRTLTKVMRGSRRQVLLQAGMHEDGWISMRNALQLAEMKCYTLADLMRLMAHPTGHQHFKFVTSQGEILMQVLAPSSSRMTFVNVQAKSKARDAGQQSVVGVTLTLNNKLNSQWLPFDPTSEHWQPFIYHPLVAACLTFVGVHGVSSSMSGVVTAFLQNGFASQTGFTSLFPTLRKEWDVDMGMLLLDTRLLNACHVNMVVQPSTGKVRIKVAAGSFLGTQYMHSFVHESGEVTLRDFFVTEAADAKHVCAAKASDGDVNDTEHSDGNEDVQQALQELQAEKCLLEDALAQEKTPFNAFNAGSSAMASQKATSVATQCRAHCGKIWCRHSFKCCFFLCA